MLAAKRHWKVDKAMPTMLEVWGDKAFYGFNGMVDVEARARYVGMLVDVDFSWHAPCGNT